MAGYVGYNQASDIGNSFGGVGDILGSAILRGAIMRQQQRDRQQQLMLEVARLRQEQENAQSLGKYREEEIGLRKKEGEREDTKLGFAKQKADEGAAETAMRRRFAGSMRNVGIGPLLQGPEQGGGNLSDPQVQQADAQESAAFLSNEPKNALDTILRMQALRELGGKLGPTISQEMVTGMPLHNVPPGNVAVPPGGGPPVSIGLPRAQAGQDLSANTALTEWVKMLATEGGYANRTNNPIAMALEPFIRQLVTKGLGTNAPTATTGGTLDPQTAAKFLQQSGGDKDKARQMAREAGYTF